MEQWEYKLINFGINLSALLKIARWDLELEGVKFKTEADIVAYMNRLGDEGWELVNTNNGTDHSGNITKIICFFKRRKKAPEAPPPV